MKLVDRSHQTKGTTTHLLTIGIILKLNLILQQLVVLIIPPLLN